MSLDFPEDQPDEPEKSEEAQRLGQFAEARMRMIQSTDLFLNMEGNVRFYTLLDAIKSVWMKMDAHGHQQLPSNPDQAATAALGLFWGEFMLDCLLVNCVLRGEAAPVPMRYPGMERNEPPPVGMKSRWVSSPTARQKITALQANFPMDMAEWLEPEVPFDERQDPSVPDPDKFGLGFLSQSIAMHSAAVDKVDQRRLIEAAESVCTGFVEEWELLVDDKMRSRVDYLIERLRALGSRAVASIDKLRSRNKFVAQVEEALADVGIVGATVLMQTDTEIRVTIAGDDEQAWIQLRQAQLPRLLTDAEEPVQILFALDLERLNTKEPPHGKESREESRQESE